MVRKFVNASLAAVLFAAFSLAYAFPLAPAMLRNPDTDPNWNNVRLLIQPRTGDTAPTDYGPHGHTLTSVGTVTLSTAVGSPFSGGHPAVECAQSGDYITIPDHNDWALSTVFTIEAWVYYPGTVTASTNFGIVGQFADGDNNWALGNYNSFLFTNKGLDWYTEVANSAVADVDMNGDFSTTYNNVWTHIAVVRNGTNHKIFINGTNVINEATATNYTVPNLAAVLTVCRTQSQLGTYQGMVYIGAMRITDGVARYSANFTPSTAMFPLRGPQ